MEQETQDFINAVDSEGGEVYENSVDTLISTLKTEGLWAKADALGFFKWSKSEQAARMCMKRLEMGSLNGGISWDNEEGFIGDGIDGHFRTGFSPTAGTPNYSQNSASYAVFYKDDIDTAYTGNSNTTLRAWPSNNVRMQYRIQTGSTVIAGSSDTPTRNGLIAINRSASDAMQLNINGSQRHSDSASSVSLNNSLFYVLGRNSNTGGGNVLDEAQNNTARAYWIGGSLTAGEWETLTDAFNQYFIDAEAEDSAGFSILSPENQSTGVPRQTPFSIANGFSHHNLRIYADDSGSPGSKVRDVIFAGDEYTLTEEQQLDSQTPYHAEVYEWTPGGPVVDPTLFIDNFDYADQSGWQGWDVQVLQGDGGASVVGNRGLLTADGGEAENSIVVADRENINYANSDLIFRFSLNEINPDFQPTFHFRTNGTWGANTQIQSYWVYLWDNGTNNFHIGRTIPSGGNPTGNTAIQASENVTLAANTDYEILVRPVDDYHFLVSIHEAGQWNGNFLLDWTDTGSYYNEGGISIKNAVVSSADPGRVISMERVQFSIAPQATTFSLISVGTTSVTIGYTEVTFDNEGYWYRQRELEGSFGSWIEITTEDQFEVTGLTSDTTYEFQGSTVHNGNRVEGNIIEATPEGASIDSISFSPSSPEISEEDGSTVTISRSLTTSGSPDTSGAWSLQGGASGITIQSQTDSQVTLITNGNPNPTDTRTTRWTANHDGTFDEVIVTVIEAPAPPSGDEQGDREALAQLYEDTDGPSSWSNTTGWSTNPANINFSNLYGVVIENNRVKSIKLNGNETIAPGSSSGDGIVGGNGLSGTISNVPFENLTEMWYINLKQNNITGSLPAGLFNLPNLERMHLNGHQRDFTESTNLNMNKSSNDQLQYRSNIFTGPLPTNGNLPKLEFLEIVGRGHPNDINNNGTGTDNGLTGPLQAWMGSTSLKGLAMSYNAFNDWTNLGSLDLHQLYMQRNAFSGKGLPSWFENFVNMRTMDIEANRFGGAFPDTDDWVNIRFCWSIFNDLTTNFPWHWLNGSNPNINMMEFGHNNFSDSVGLPQLGSNNLNALTLTNNNMSGSIHPSWGTNASRLSNFSLSNNNFSGTFPQDFTGSNNNRYIRVDGNNFEGSLPNINGDLSSWNGSLWFRNNEMSGTISTSVANEYVKAVQNGASVLDIRNNKFTQGQMQNLIDAFSNAGLSSKLLTSGQNP